MLEAPEKGFYPSFWLANRDGVSFYHGEPSPIKLLTDRRISVEDMALDLESSQRAYIAEAGSSRVVALEGDPEGLLEGRLLEVAAQDLGEQVEYVQAESTEVYAATRDKLFVMRREDLSVEETVDFREPLADEALKSAPVSGMAVGKEKVYLTLEGQPYVVRPREAPRRARGARQAQGRDAARLQDGEVDPGDRGRRELQECRQGLRRLARGQPVLRHGGRDLTARANLKALHILVEEAREARRERDGPAEVTAGQGALPRTTPQIQA